jgi:hypothetical protein
MDRDLEHLNLLSIFYYIVAGLNLVGTCLLSLYFFFIGGVLMFAPRGGHGAPPVQILVPIVIVIGGFVVLLSLTMAVLAFFTGRFLKQRRHHLFCTVMAVIECLHFPLGTILGVFTILVLQRPRVQQMFKETSAAA